MAKLALARQRQSQLTPLAQSNSENEGWAATVLCLAGPILEARVAEELIIFGVLGLLSVKSGIVKNSPAPTISSLTSLLNSCTCLLI